MLAFNVDEEQEGDEGQGEGRVDERVVPGNDIAARVQPKEKEDQCRDKRRGAKEVDALEG